VAIFFSCSCGQSLRADENGAAGFTRCPACGRLARVPSLHGANQALGINAEEGEENSAPPPPLPPPVVTIPPIPVSKLLLVEEARMPPVRPARRPPPPVDDDEDESPYRLTTSRDDDNLDNLRARIDRDKVRRLLKEARKELTQRHEYRQHWSLETHWSHCLLYPLRLALYVGLLSVAWATATALGVAFLPDTWNATQLSVYIPLSPFYLVLIAYTLALLQTTFRSASRGAGGLEAVPRMDPVPIARSGLQGLLCLVVGPIVPLIVAYFFWIDSGEIEAVDRLILAELGMVAMICWALLFLAVTDKDSFLSANPLAVVKLIQRHSFRVPLTALVMAVALVGHGYLMFNALEDMYRGLLGWMELVGLWAGMLYWLLFVLRWYGLSSGQWKKAVGSEQ
jgi:hypothetical protein